MTVNELIAALTAFRSAGDGNTPVTFHHGLAEVRLVARTESGLERTRSIDVRWGEADLTAAISGFEEDLTGASE